MTNEKQYFTQKEMKERLIEVLEYYSNDDAVDVGDLIHDAFNNDYYIIYINEAEKALEEYGVFEALGEIQASQKLHFGEILTDLSSSVDVANTLWLIHSEHYVLNELDLYQYETVGEMLEALQN